MPIVIVMSIPFLLKEYIILVAFSDKFMPMMPSCMATYRYNKNSFLVISLFDVSKDDQDIYYIFILEIDLVRFICIA